ncbi:GIY-YIG nuclease family protein [Kaistella palustris]|uniref:GIY-YIG nuclease family protein n=1 Tax=Kaistella palustris TaxID=493376 RepID=UPI0003F4C654|nr:GIY-YIG nuclease family protein [Kaistella palustris]
MVSDLNSDLHFPGFGRDFFMDFVVYILYSKKYKKQYVGFTSDLINRFHSHNSLSTKGFTLRYCLWEVIYVEFYNSKSEAMAREKFFKSGAGRDWINLNIAFSDE